MSRSVLTSPANGWDTVASPNREGEPARRTRRRCFVELLVDHGRRQRRCERVGQRLELRRESLEPLDVQAVVTSDALHQTRIACRDHRRPLVEGSERNQFLRVAGELDLQLRVEREELIPRRCWLSAFHDGAQLRPRISREHPCSLADEHLRREGWLPFVGGHERMISTGRDGYPPPRRCDHGGLVGARLRPKRLALPFARHADVP
jgi:hypothetical protein